MSLRFLRSNSKVMTCHVVLLDNSQFVTTFDQKIVLGKDLFDLVCQRVQVPNNKKQYFGLQYIDQEDGDLNWLVFAQDPHTMQQGLQKQILLQIKGLLNRGKLSLPVEKHAEIDGLYVQAALGDFIAKRHKRGYLEDLLGLFYCPPTGINSEEHISEERYEIMVRDLHKRHRGMSREEAISAATEVCKELPEYGAWKHYGGTDPSKGNEVVFCVSIYGIRICQLKSKFPETGEECHNFHWRDIISMVCDKEKFCLYLTDAAAADASGLTCRVFRFDKGLYSHKAAQRLLVDAENHQKFFFEDNPVRATVMRSLSVDVKTLNRIRSLRAGSVSFLRSKTGLSFRRGTST
ncbi:PREDICTED: merlin-like [Acropora digitifera]|uniref:merlin-like n=1 Tax=Acropora digitifera TaxID=70779 RepID=UPI00077A334C|nr:PREDICTED: merlin-like [Acropora digitifera]